MEYWVQSGVKNTTCMSLSESEEHVVIFIVESLKGTHTVSKKIEIRPGTKE